MLSHSSPATRRRIAKETASSRSPFNVVALQPGHPTQDRKGNFVFAVPLQCCRTPKEISSSRSPVNVVALQPRHPTQEETALKSSGVPKSDVSIGAPTQTPLSSRHVLHQADRAPDSAGDLKWSPKKKRSSLQQHGPVSSKKVSAGRRRCTLWFLAATPGFSVTWMFRPVFCVFLLSAPTLSPPPPRGKQTKIVEGFLFPGIGARLGMCKG